jgi:hypothetical protein
LRVFLLLGSGRLRERRRCFFFGHSVTLCTARIGKKTGN